MDEIRNDQELAEGGGAADDDIIQRFINQQQIVTNHSEEYHATDHIFQVATTNSDDSDENNLGVSRTAEANLTEHSVRVVPSSSDETDPDESILGHIEHPNDWGATHSHSSDNNRSDGSDGSHGSHGGRGGSRGGGGHGGRGGGGRGHGGGGNDGGGYDGGDDAAASKAPERELTRLALRMAILEKAANGVGTLAFVWATVVLLGGFAVLLEPKDFYVVTAILLIEGTRVFTRNHEVDSGFFFRATKAVFEPCSVSSRSVGWILTFLQLLSATACAVLSSMRLVEQHYGDVDQDGTERNRAPALDIFYGLALAQALLFLAEKAYWHWKISYGKLLEQTRHACGFSDSGIVSLRRFFHCVYWKCISGNVFDALDMDLTAFALVLFNSDSHGDQLIGARILRSYVKHELYAEDTVDRIVISAQSVRRLVAMLGWKSPAQREIRLHAAMVVARLAGDKRGVLRVIGIPGAMQSIASLLHVGKRRVNHDNKFNLLGLHILNRLACDIDNCTRIRNARGLLPKIIEFTRGDRNVSKLKKRSLKVVMRLVSTAGKTGRLLRRDILDNIFVVMNIRDILYNRIDYDYRSLSILGIEILTGLALEKSARKKIGSTGGVIELLLSNFLNPEARKRDASLVVKIGDALTMLATESKSNCAKILKWSEEVVTKIVGLLNEDAFTVSASKLLRNLCMYAGSELRNRLRGAGATLPRVLKAIMREEGKLLEVSISLSVQISKLVGPEDYANELDQSGISEIELVRRLVQVLHEHGRPTVELPRIRRSVIEQAICMMKSDNKYIDWFKECGMVKVMENVARTTSELESFMLFSGSVGVTKYKKPIASLVQTAIGLMVPHEREEGTKFCINVPVPQAV